MTFAEAVETCRRILKEAAPENSGWKLEFHGSPHGDVKVSMQVTLPSDLDSGDHAATIALDALSNGSR